MPQEFLPLASQSEAVSGLELALARVVAQVRAEFAMERRAMESELKLARAEFAAMLERLARAEAETKEQRINLRGETGPPGAAGEPGKDGAAGESGSPGRDGRDGLPGVAGAQGERGRDGTDGKDGLGFDAARQVEDSEHFAIEFLRGDEVVRKFTFSKPTLADFHCGPYRAGESYRRGQCATYGGSTFLCLRATSQKPETSDWQLIVKHGLPGRNGKDGERGPAGPVGQAGRDLTQLTSGGLKYG
jgi:Collagen triple helix repeat (20 copies)